MRVSHFVNNFSRGCAFCTLNNVNPVPDESFPHLFYNCPTSSNIQQRILRKYFSSISNGNEAAKKAFLFGCTDNGRYNLFVNLAVFSLQYLIWQMKLKKEILPYTIFELNWLKLIDIGYKQSTKIRESLLLVNYDIRRRWHG
jgi:hypothetical protein